MQRLISVLIAVLLTTPLYALPRNLIVVNGLGETSDFANLTDSTIARQVATLGLAPNDFVVAGSTGVAINSSSSDLYFFALPSMAPTGRLFLGSQRNPYNGAVLNQDTLLITNLVSSTVTKIDVANRRVIGEYNVGKSPEGILIMGYKAYICITNFSFQTYTYGPGLVQVFDLRTNTVTASIPVEINPQDIALGYDGFLYVICTGDYVSHYGTLCRINPATNSVVASLPVGGSPGSLAITRSGVLFLAAGGFTGHGEIYTVNLGNFTLLRGPANPIYTDLGVTSVVAVSDSTVVSCNFSHDTITEITGSGRIISRFTTGDGPVAAAKFPACYLVHGDADGSGQISIADAVLLINFIFSGSPVPVSAAAGDANCDSLINISDAVGVINYVFGGVARPCGCAD
jgi:YVTN family beta-propeller protein